MSAPDFVEESKDFPCKKNELENEMLRIANDLLHTMEHNHVKLTDDELHDSVCLRAVYALSKTKCLTYSIVTGTYQFEGKSHVYYDIYLKRLPGIDDWTPKIEKQAGLNRAIEAINEAITAISRMEETVGTQASITGLKRIRDNLHECLPKS